MLIAEATNPITWIGFIAFFAAAFFAVFSARAAQSRKDLSQSVIALQGRLTANQDELAELRATNARQAEQIENGKQQVADVRAQMSTLERVVTGHDQIVELTAVVRAGFVKLGVSSTDLPPPVALARPTG